MPQDSSNIEVLLQVMRQRRNTRRFKPDPVPEEYISAIVEAARLAPSGANSQPWEIIAIRDPERKRQIADIFVESAKKGSDIDPLFPAPSEVTNRTKLTEASVLLAFCADTRFKQAYPGYANRESIFYESIGIAMEHIHLAAVALGLGIGWGTTNRFSEGPLGELLGVHPPLVIKEVFSIGFPVADAPAKSRRDLSNVVHFEQLDASKVRTDEEIANLIANRRVPDIYSGANSESKRR